MRTVRFDGRAVDELRSVRITPGFQKHAEGSALIELGETKVICAVSVESRIPAFLRGSGSGWITAEYGMLPRATHTRTKREAAAGKVGGRTMEIQRLIGRSLRGIADLETLGERTFSVDCDVIQADGGTRTASITGAYVALAQAFRTLQERGELTQSPLTGAVTATSVGIVDGAQLLDLCYEEDSHAEVDFNIVMTDTGELVEVQGTAEGKPFSKNSMNELITLAEKGIGELFELQKTVIAELG
ncbi:MAG: ribonuclease PH [Chloroflexi bacterium]|jgi:ribonuclease PH|nr:ribonuclease PH [Chloroflexota bacterium]